MPRKIVVVGGGITGLACAWRVLEIARERKCPVQLLLVDEGRRLGGVISTLRRDGLRLESGPDAIFTEKPWGVDFLRRVGLESELIGTNPKYRKSFIAFAGRLSPVPEGFYMIAPSQIFPLLTTPILSLKGKLRAFCDLLISRRDNGGDESLDSFVSRRLGREILERMAQPMVGGIYASDPRDLSLEATFPAFLEMERDHGSVIRGLWARSRKSSHIRNAHGPRYSLFVAIDGGMERLIEKASEGIPRDSIKLGVSVKEVRLTGKPAPKFRVVGNGLDTEADAVCLTTPAWASASVLREMDGDLSADLDRIPYHSSATVNLVYKREDIPHPLDGFGFVVPEVEKKSVSGCTFSSVKFPGRCPEDKAILRCFMGFQPDRDQIEAPDKDLAGMAENVVKEYLGVSEEPILRHVTRYPRSMPQYRVGHRDLVKKIESRLEKFSGLAMAGNAFYGVGIPDCIHSGESAAEKIMSHG